MDNYLPNINFIMRYLFIFLFILSTYGRLYDYSHIVYDKAYDYGYIIWKTVKGSRYIIDIKVGIKLLYIE